MSESDPNAGHEDAYFQEPPHRAEPAGSGSAWRIVVGINILVFALMVITGAGLFSPNVRELIKWGANFGPLTMTSQPWRLVTSLFVHIGLIHIFFNMVCLMQLGPAAEELFGTRRFLTLYLLSGLGGSIASNAWNPETVSAGASGAIFGIVGGFIGFILRRKGQLAPDVFKSQLNSMLSFVGYNLFIGFTIPHIDNSAHIGGLITGFLLGILALQSNQSLDGKSRVQEWLATGFVVVALACGGAYAHSRATANETGSSVHSMTMDDTTVGNMTLEYDPGIPKELVAKFGEGLKTIHYADSKATVLLSKASDRVEIGFVVNPVAVKNDTLLNEFKSLALYFSKRVFDEKPVDITFFDSSMKPLKTVHWEDVAEKAVQDKK